MTAGCLEVKTLKNLYNAFIQPHINYGLILWGTADKIQTNKIALNLKKAVRIITFNNKNDHSAPLFKHLGILTFDKNLLFQQGKYIHLEICALLTPKLHSRNIYCQQKHCHKLQNSEQIAYPNLCN